MVVDAEHLVAAGAELVPLGSRQGALTASLYVTDIKTSLRYFSAPEFLMRQTIRAYIIPVA